jgi:hypothetical protein
MKSSVLFATVCLLACGSASATVVLTISNPAVGVLTNIADSTGTTANGLSWGIVVDAQGNGFASSTLFGPSAGLLLQSNFTGVSLPGSDDVFFFDSAVVTAMTPGPRGGSGSITSFFGLNLNSALGVSTGDAFAIVWFDRGFGTGSTSTADTRWGFLTDPSFVLPPDGANQPYYSLFTGVDPVRPVPTPEPSALILSLLGVLPFLRRRR